MNTLLTKIVIPSVSPPHRRDAGFSLFELVVFIIAVAIIYAYAANRFAEFPGQAERANFLAITVQLQSAISMEMMFGVNLGRISSPENLEGLNPMELLLEPPANYMGDFDIVDASRVQRRVWYFDRQQKELVYLVNDTTGVFFIQNEREVPTDEIRFRVVANYSEYDKKSGLPVKAVESGGSEVAAEDRETRLDGIVMRPVVPFRWGEAAPSMLIDEAIGETSG